MYRFFAFSAIGATSIDASVWFRTMWFSLTTTTNAAMVSLISKPLFLFVSLERERDTHVICPLRPPSYDYQRCVWLSASPWFPISCATLSLSCVREQMCVQLLVFFSLSLVPYVICYLVAHSTERSEWMTDVSIWVYNKKKKLKYNARKIEAWKCCSNCGIQSSTYSTWTQYKEVLSRVDAIHTMKGITCSNDKRLTGQPTERKRLRLTDAVLLVWSSAVLIAVEELSYRPTLMCKLLLSAGTLV